MPFYLQIKQEDGNYKIEIYRKEQYSLKREIPFDKLPNFLRKAIIRLIERKNHINEPYALARSMSWRELENMAKRIAVITVQRSTWEVIENLSQRFRNELEKRELLETVLSVERLGDKTLIAVEKSKLKKAIPYTNSLTP